MKACLCLDLHLIQISSSPKAPATGGGRLPSPAPPLPLPHPPWKHPHLLSFSLPFGASTQPPAKLHCRRAPSTSPAGRPVTKLGSRLTGSRWRERRATAPRPAPGRPGPRGAEDENACADLQRAAARPLLSRSRRRERRPPAPPLRGHSPKGSSGLGASDMTPGPVLGRVREISTRGDRWTAGLLPLGR